MNNDPKKTKEELIEEYNKALQEAWGDVSGEIGNVRDAVASGVKSYVTDPARDGINYARQEGIKFYKVVEGKVGSDRLIGASLGAWKLGGIGAIFGPLAMVKGTVVGGVAGFVLGRKIKTWLDEGQNNNPPDTPADTASETPPTDKPPEPKP